MSQSSAFQNKSFHKSNIPRKMTSTKYSQERFVKQGENSPETYGIEDWNDDVSINSWMHTGSTTSKSVISLFSTEEENLKSCLDVSKSVFSSEKKLLGEVSPVEIVDDRCHSSSSCEDIEMVSSVAGSPDVLEISGLLHYEKTANGTNHNGKFKFNEPIYEEAIPNDYVLSERYFKNKLVPGKPGHKDKLLAKKQLLSGSDSEVDFDISSGKQASTKKNNSLPMTIDLRSSPEKSNLDSQESVIDSRDVYLPNKSRGLDMFSVISSNSVKNSIPKHAAHIQSTSWSNEKSIPLVSNNKGSRMIDLEEIKRELEGNPHNSRSSISSLNTAFSMMGQSQLDIEQLKLHYNIRALKVVMYDILKTKTKFNGLHQRKGNKKKETKNCNDKVPREKKYNIFKESERTETKLKELGGIGEPERKKKKESPKKNKDFNLCTFLPVENKQKEEREKNCVKEDRRKFDTSTDAVNAGSLKAVSESYEDMVARKLAERNKKLGIATSTLSRRRSPSPESSRKSKANEDSRSLLNQDYKEIQSSVPKNPGATAKLKSCITKKSPLKANVSTPLEIQMISSLTEFNSNHVNSYQHLTSHRIAQNTSVRSPKKKSIIATPNSSKSGSLLLNIEPSIILTRKLSSPLQSNQSELSEEETTQVPPKDLMHPSMRMSLLTKKSASETTFLGQESTTDRHLPNHPSLRLSQQVLQPSSPNKSVSSLNECGEGNKRQFRITASSPFGRISSGKDIYSQRTKSAPESMSKQIGSRGILLSPNSSKSRQTFLGNNVMLDSSIESETDVIGISDSESESSSSSALVMTQVFHISSNDASENEDDGNNRTFVDSTAPNIGGIDQMVTLQSISTSSLLTLQTSAEKEQETPFRFTKQSAYECYIIPSDDEDELPNLSEMRRRRKTSSKRRIETFIVNSNENQSFTTPIKTTRSIVAKRPTCFEPASEAPPIELVSSKLTKTFFSQSKPVIRSVSQRQMRKLSDHFELSEIQIKVVKLSNQTIRNLIQLCTKSTVWNTQDELRKAGLSKYDITRLGAKGLRKKCTTSRYTFRKFLKKRERYVAEDTVSKRLKEIKRRQKKAEKQQVEIIAIRRALLKINAKFMNQNHFWSYLDRMDGKFHFSHSESSS